MLTVFENHRKSLSTLQAKRATFTFWVDKLIKNAKNGQFGRIFENLKLAVNQCYQTGQFNRTKLLENAKIQMRHFE